MLIIAGLIEGFISPATIPAYYKLGLSATTGILLVAYFLKPDPREPQESTEGVPTAPRRPDQAG
jgi:hypothetical protein